MKLTLFSKLLITTVLMMGANAAWADTTIGATANNYSTDGSYTTAALLKEGETRTFAFVVDALNQGGNWQQTFASYIVNLTKTDTPTDGNANAYLFLRSSDWAFRIAANEWNTGDVYNANTFGTTTVNSVIIGATVTLSIKRNNKYVIVTSQIATTSSGTFYHNFVQDLDTTDDIYCFLAADFAQLTINSDETTSTNKLGATDKNWLQDGSHSDYYTIASGKTLTLTFFINDSRGDNDADGYGLQIRDNTTFEDVWNEHTYAFLRSWCDYISKGVWNTNATYNVNNYGSVTKKDFFKGAAVTMIIRRYGTDIIITTNISKESTTYTHSYVQNIGTTNDIYAYLGADYSVLVPMGAVLTDTNVSVTNPVEIPVGKADNTETWSAIYNQVLAPEETVCFHFTNYNDGGNTLFHNWTTGLTYYDNTSSSDKYFDLTSGDLAAWGTLNDDNETSSSTKTNWPDGTSNIMTKLNGADVTMTMSRSGRKVFITAVHTPTSGDPFTFKYTFEPNDSYSNFATDNIWVRLVARSSHFTLYYPTDKVNAEVSKYGWATFSSDYKLDFTGISGLKAFAVTGITGNVVNMSDELGVVDAGTGVLLNRTTSGETSVYFNIPVSTDAAYSGDNLMVAGTGAAVTKEDGYTNYVLSVANEEAVLQYINNTNATVAKGKAYLHVANPSPAPFLYFDWSTPTAIEAVETAAKAQQDGVFYNIVGQRVAQPKKGLYIVNGKKIIK